MNVEEFVGGHYSLVVPAVEDTVDFLSATLSVDFRAPAQIPFRAEGHGEEFPLDVRVCFSTDGLVELVEAGDKGPFAGPGGIGLHHYGGVVRDLEGAVAAQQARGNRPEWRLSYEDQLIAVFFAGTEALPGSLEFVSAAAPPLLEMFEEGK